MTARRLLLALVLAATAATAMLGCGFGRADDSGKPIPGRYWGWACPDSGAPAPDAGCRAADAGTGSATSDGAVRD